MKIITCVFGHKYSGMLLGLLNSIEKSNPDTFCEVYFQDMDDLFIGSLKRMYHNVDFFLTKFNFTNDRLQRISSKTLMWEFAINSQTENEEVIILDVDTLVVKSISNYLKSFDFDILFTVKNEKYPINTGVLGVKISIATKEFFKKWKLETMKILQDMELLKKANSISFPYGAADQMSFYQIISFDLSKSEFLVQGNERHILVKAAPCNILNETNSRHITNDIVIIHYKAGWQRVLIDGLAFTKNRTFKDSKEMYVFYLNNFEDALGKLNIITNNMYSAKDLSINIPLWAKQSNLFLQKIFYSLVKIKSFFKKVAYLINRVPQKLLQFWQ